MLFWCLVFVFHGHRCVSSEELLSSNSIFSSNETNKDSELRLEGGIHFDIENVTEVPETTVHQMSIRSLSFDSVKTNDTFKVGDNNITLIRDFKPSPSLGSFYEHNGQPEAKIANRNQIFSLPAETTTVPAWIGEQLLPKPWPQKSWNDVRKNDSPRNGVEWGQKTTEFGSVKFPSATGYDHPYAYAYATGPDNLPPGTYPLTTPRFVFNQPVDVYTTPKPAPSLWSKFMSTMGIDYRGSEPDQKTFSGFNLLEKPAYFSQPYRGHTGYGSSGHSGYESAGWPGGYGYGHSGHSAIGGIGGFGDYGSYGGFKSGVSPWKKVIKFLAAVIPIGLFLSALAPTVIQVQSVNDTTM